jgi:hypothetical protein
MSMFAHACLCVDYVADRVIEFTAKLAHVFLYGVATSYSKTVAIFVDDDKN